MVGDITLFIGSNNDNKNGQGHAMIECAGCGRIGTAADLIAPWSDWPPGCPSCLNNDFLDVEETEKEL